MTEFKVLPLAVGSEDATTLARERLPVRSFPTPMVTLSEAAVQNNLETMGEEVLRLAKSGKTALTGHRRARSRVAW